MATDAEIWALLYQAFASCPRPAHFTNYQHCCECFEHDQLLRSRDLETLAIADVGSPAWDPICFITPQGFAYYFPALARLALSAPDADWGWYGEQLFFHLVVDGSENRRWQFCTPQQRQAIAGLIEYLIETRTDLIEVNGCTEMAFDALEIWSAESP
ncbi:DUF6714 family protein [Almyronema epifaneia]|uniref:DUF6714 family protein n=1 Tax=Almyronema epifaneia S1 TaxID=2991925 RepID=A0ABW6IIL2_9CYAN